ncbi:hypothetical protein A4A49_01647 [Nicotiana attenuata]|uniref:Uncharacterized protein n=1 Tax=Nicotiana attenuata TaxID=49451 RepID=A0A1J6IBP3_NICAT|nr:hypothetical protein A4A49_01647 [Nicotiana attenuata]
MSYSETSISSVINPNQTNGLFEEELPNGKPHSLLPSPSHNSIIHLLQLTTGPHAKVMAEDGYSGALSKPSNDGRGCRDGSNHPKPLLFSTLDDPTASSGPDKLWTPTVDIHTTPSPIHGEPTTHANGGNKQSHGSNLSDYALFPPYESGSSDPIAPLPSLATNSPSTPTNPQPLSPIDLLSRGTTMAPDYLRGSNVDLENMLEKLAVPKTKAFLMQEPLR